MFSSFCDQIVKIILLNGGIVFGGYVRDMLSKDIPNDIDVYFPTTTFDMQMFKNNKNEFMENARAHKEDMNVKRDLIISILSVFFKISVDVIDSNVNESYSSRVVKCNVSSFSSSYHSIKIDFVDNIFCGNFDFDVNMLELTLNGIQVRKNYENHQKYYNGNTFISIMNNVKERRMEFVWKPSIFFTNERKDILMKRLVRMIEKGWKIGKDSANDAVALYNAVAVIPNDNDCPICLENFELFEYVVKTWCDHYFCFKCFLKVCEKKTCELCRQSFAC